MMCIKKEMETISVNPHLREERNKIMSDLQIKHDAMISALEAFQGKGDNDIPKKKLKSFPLMEWIEVSKGVLVRKRKTLLGDIIPFDTIMQKGSEFGLHKHSDCIEICDIEEGEIVDLKTNDIYISGDQAIWEKGEEHIPVAMEKTVLKVYFK